MKERIIELITSAVKEESQKEWARAYADLKGKKPESKWQPEDEVLLKDI